MMLDVSRPSEQETVGQRLRRLRRERGLSQDDLSGEGVSTSYVSYLERDRRAPSHKALRTLANKLGVSVEYLETGATTSARDTAILDAELELRLGSVATAVPAFERTLEQARALGDAETMGRAEAGLILAATALGDHDGAVQRFEAIPATARPAVAARPDLYATAGRSLASLGRATEAVALLQSCLDEITGMDIVDDALYVRFAVDLSYAFTDCGNLASAHEVLASAIQRADGLGDTYARIRLYWSLARLNSVDGSPELTVAYCKRAIALLEGTEDHFHLASAHEALASALLDQNDASGALPHLDTAELLYRNSAAPGYLTSLTVERARYAAHAGRADEAKQLALSALDELDNGAVDADDAGTCWRTLAQVYADLGEQDLAGHCFSHAIESLEAAPVKYLADTLHAYAEFLNEQGRHAEAYETLRRASGLTRGEPANRASAAATERE